MSQKRIEEIRKGNALFREGKYKEAAKLFIHTHYKDGLIRLGDFYFYEKNDLVSAIKFYHRAGYKKGIDSMIERMVPVIRKWLKQDQKEGGAGHLKEEKPPEDQD